MEEEGEHVAKAARGSNDTSPRGQTRNEKDKKIKEAIGEHRLKQLVKIWKRQVHTNQTDARTG